MKKIISLLLLLITATLSAQDISGAWNGLLSIPGGEVRLIFNLEKDGDNYTATMDSPDQGATGIPATAIFEGNALTVTVPAANIEYKGKYENNGFTGSFNQNGFSLPLNLSRETIEAKKVNRPQEPAAPYPYYTEDVTFTNEQAGINLAGTLTLPKKEGNYPAVVLISGSGPQNRDEEVMGHKPFLVLADHLTKNGIAVLRYDDRGIAESKGKFAGATTSDFATDAAAAFKYLKTRKEINAKKIGLAGHSEGGTIAPIVASENKDIAFIVLMAGTAIPGDENMMLQNYMLGKADGMPEEELTKLAKINRKIYDAIKAEQDARALKSEVTAIFNKEFKPLLISKGIPQEQVTKYIEIQSEELSSSWYTHFIRYNPAPALEKVTCPILAINGSNDLQVAPKANLDAVKRATDKSGNKRVTVKELPGLNHLFQESTTGAVAEYETIEQTFAPAALNEISGWIVKQVK